MPDSSNESKSVTKLLAMADNVVHRRNIYRRAPWPDQPTEFGRLDKSIDALAESAEKCRKSDQARES